MTSPKTTIKDIAKALGLSVATVSRSLNSSHEVSEETRMRVLSKARELSYKPNIHARNLLKRRNNMVGVVVPEFTTFFFPEIIIGIQEVLNAEGYQVLICQSSESTTLERRNIEMLESSMVEGLIVSVTKDAQNTALYHRIIGEGTPVVFVNRVLPELHATQVVIDDRKWAFNRSPSGQRTSFHNQRAFARLSRCSLTARHSHQRQIHHARWRAARSRQSGHRLSAQP